MAACMIAKLRVGWMVAGCAPGVRTITRSALFHCKTGLTDWEEESPSLLCPYELLTCTERMEHKSVSVIKILDIAISPFLLICESGGTGAPDESRRSNTLVIE